MSLRRAERTVESLWRDMNPVFVGHGTKHHARQSPPTVQDLEEYSNSSGAYDAHEHASHRIAQPPKLAGPGGCMRCVIALTFAACFAAVVFVAMTIVNRLPFTIVHTGHAHAPSQLASGAPAQPVPALLKRFAKLEKAAPPDRGASQESIDALFPQWKHSDATSNAVRDIALGVGILVQHLQKPTVPPAESDSPAQEASNNEDTDL